MGEEHPSNQRVKLHKILRKYKENKEFGELRESGGDGFIRTSTSKDYPVHGLPAIRFAGEAQDLALSGAIEEERWKKTKRLLGTDNKLQKMSGIA
jgi:hypothetical protein